MNGRTAKMADEEDFISCLTDLQEDLTEGRIELKYALSLLIDFLIDYHESDL